MSLIIGASFPLIISIYLIFIKEKYRSKDYRIMLLSILAGIGMLIVSFLFESYLKIFNLNPLLQSFIQFASVEEGSKFLMLYCLVYRLKTESSTYDFIKTALLSSLIFALIENLLYVNIYYVDYGMLTAYIRIYSAIPMHAICGISMGYLISIYEKDKSVLFIILSILIPIIIHGFYDYFLIIGIPGYAFLVLILSILMNLKPMKKYFI